MVAIKVFGGLGNQMFQYAFYLYQQIMNDEVYLDTSDYKTHKHHYGFELEKVFDINVDKLTGKDLRVIRMNPNTLVRRAINKLFNIQVVRGTEVREYPAAIIALKYKYSENIFFNGYWAKKIYIDEVEERLRKEFVFRYQPEGKNLELLKVIEGKNSVSVHVRRGDFLKNSRIANCCDIEYYRKAFQFFLDKNSETVFVVFSDDINWARENIAFSENILFVDWNIGVNSHRDMQMMSLCKHNIIANSTFSWWGGWLNANPGKCIVAPKRWSENNDNENQLVYKDWILF